MRAKLYDLFILYFSFWHYVHTGQGNGRRLVETVYCAFRLHGIFETAHLNLRRANIIFARQKCFYLLIPLCSNACQHTNLEQVSAQVSRYKACNRFTCLCFKSASKVSPPLSLFGSHFIFRQNRKSSSSSFGLSLPRNHTETLALARLLRLLQGGFARGLEAFEFVTEIDGLLTRSIGSEERKRSQAF